mmetsp:Transcript_25005/g.85567  ORF Transcript_25005/g.85567 Transcript_25005/m.85567 type:complete len:219 (-) Transcript_25005:9327-9983(-)
MRKYLQMLITQAHKPAAAPDLVTTISGLKSAIVMYSFSTFSTQFSGVLSLSKSMRDLRNWSTLPILFFPAFQLRSLGIFPPGAHNTMQAATTCTTISAGEPKDFNSPRLFLSNEFSAASASRMIGSAALRSSAHSSWKLATSSAILAHAASSSAPASTSLSTLTFSSPMEARRASVALFFSSTITCSCLRLTCKSATCAEACAIFSTPLSRRSFASLS